MSTPRAHMLYSKSPSQPKGAELLDEMTHTESRTRNVQNKPETSHSTRKQGCLKTSGFMFLTATELFYK